MFMTLNVQWEVCTAQKNLTNAKTVACLIFAYQKMGVVFKQEYTR